MPAVVGEAGSFDLSGHYPDTTRAQKTAKSFGNHRVDIRFGTERSEAWRAVAFGDADSGQDAASRLEILAKSDLVVLVPLLP